MRKFGIVLQYELANYIKNKSFMFTTIILLAVVLIGTFLPRIFDMSGILDTVQESEQDTLTEETQDEDTDTSTMILYDQSDVLGDLSLLKSMFPGVTWTIAESESQVKEAVESETADVGYVVKSLTEYDYYVYNKGLSDSSDYLFQSYLTTLNQINYCQQNGLNYEQIATAFSPQITSSEQILGKDMTQNYFYCYFLVILIFMIIIIYGVMIATSVTQEKSNRAIEVLVTSTTSDSLLFGKVIAGAIASIIQVGVVLMAAILGYRINQEVWGHKLDFILEVPNDVLITFAFFGAGGFLFYAFIYGAVGALVSKTEDINKSAGGIQMLIMIVYFAVLAQLSNIDGIVMKVASFLPFSSYSAMFTRVAMGKVATWEIIVSFLILIVSIVLVGILGAKIYRMGTLRYGNPISFKSALKAIREEKKA